jgi:malate dehydrogenase (oxaloacetate-decarboxylating)(NADP+)
MSQLKADALKYHEFPRPGKLETAVSKRCETQYDLSLAYSPGVAEPVLAIAENAADVYRYTNKGNLVAVISNGTAILGLGNRGALASKPVMEGKGVLFKKFANIDVFDIEVDTTDTEEFIRTVANIAPTFGGINLEDISSPACFEIETRLQAMLDIPVFHDDQHGTAIIGAAGLLNALEIAGKKIEDIKLVHVGVGAAGTQILNLLMHLGLKKENLWAVDRNGILRTNDPELSSFHAPFARDTDLTELSDAVKGADVFIGTSVANILTPEMLLSMNASPIVFAMANPNPEITPELAKATREDVIIATGRSDYPNQVNNVLGFPFIFRGALDVQAKEINMDMKIACTHALKDLAKEAVPAEVLKAYDLDSLEFGREYIIPKPLDSRLKDRISKAVSQAAIDSGVARKPR